MAGNDDDFGTRGPGSPDGLEQFLRRPAVGHGNNHVVSCHQGRCRDLHMGIGIFPDSQTQAQEARSHIHADRRRVAKAEDVDTPGRQEAARRLIEGLIIEET